jgi:RNA polymerase sigma-70 factor (ECF subfamily)
MNEEEVQQLVAKVKQLYPGDQDASPSPQVAAAFDRLFELVLPLVLRIVNTFEIPGVERDELVVETKGRVWEKIPTFRGDARFTTWLHPVCRNVCINRYNQRKRLQQREEKIAAAQRDYVRASCDNNTSPQEEEARAKMDLFIRLLEARLKKQDYVIYRLTHEQGLKSHEIAELLGMTPTNVRQRLHTPIKRIVEALKTEIGIR